MNAVIVKYARSPFHFANKGLLSTTRPEEIAAQVVQHLMKEINFDPQLIDDIIAGCAYPEGAQGNNIARIIGFLSHMPISVGGMTINRFCGSSMSAIHMAAAQIEAGMGQAFLCVGVESMTMVPQGGLTFSPNNTLLETFPEAYVSMGITAENVAKKWEISRKAQDSFAYHSHMKAAYADKCGFLKDEIAPIQLESGQYLDYDGCIRENTSVATLENLKPAFLESGLVTAGTSSPLTDGASAVLVVDEKFAELHQLEPIARIKSCATFGVDPAYMGIGPVPATQLALKRANIKASDLDVIEINEAFASQALACIQELELDMSKVNIDGGALALGHPLGATGARITGKAAQLLKRKQAKYALATQCIGGGQGIATILERV